MIFFLYKILKFGVTENLEGEDHEMGQDPAAAWPAQELQDGAGSTAQPGVQQRFPIAEEKQKAVVRSVFSLFLWHESLMTYKYLEKLTVE